MTSYLNSPDDVNALVYGITHVNSLGEVYRGIIQILRGTFMYPLTSNDTFVLKHFSNVSHAITGIQGEIMNAIHIGELWFHVWNLHVDIL